MAVLHTTTWNDDGGAPVVCVHGVTGHGGRFRAPRRAACRPPRRRRRPPRARALAVGGAVDGRDAPRGPARDRRRPRHRRGHLDRAQLRRTARRGARVATPRSRRARRPPRSGDARRAAGRDRARRGPSRRLSFGSPDEAIDTRLGDGSLVSTPRATLEEEAAAFLDQGEDGRWRWRFSPTAVIAAWSEMASPAPPWPECPTLVVIGEKSWIPNRVPRLPHLRARPCRAVTPSSGTTRTRPPTRSSRSSA